MFELLLLCWWVDLSCCWVAQLCCWCGADMRCIVFICVLIALPCLCVISFALHLVLLVLAAAVVAVMCS